MTFKMKRGKYYHVCLACFILPLLTTPFYVDFSNTQNIIEFLLIIAVLLYLYRVQTNSTLTMNENSLLVQEEFTRFFEYENMSDISICDTKGITVMYAPKKVSFLYLSKGKKKTYEVSPEHVESFYEQLLKRVKQANQA